MPGSGSADFFAASLISQTRATARRFPMRALSQVSSGRNYPGRADKATRFCDAAGRQLSGCTDIHPDVHMRLAAKVPDHRRPFNLPNVPDAVVTDVLVFVK